MGSRIQSPPPGQARPTALSCFLHKVRAPGPTPVRGKQRPLTTHTPSLSKDSSFMPLWVPLNSCLHVPSQMQT